MGVSQRLMVFVMVTLTTWGAVASAQGAAEIRWQVSPANAMETAAEQGRPTLLVFSAQWCKPCHRLDRETFVEPDVVEALRPFMVARVDATDTTKVADLLRRFHVDEFPTLVLLTPSGDEFKALRVVGFVTADTLIARLRAATKARP